jgi:hypothetical protein
MSWTNWIKYTSLYAVWDYFPTIWPFTIVMVIKNLVWQQNTLVNIYAGVEMAFKK